MPGAPAWLAIAIPLLLATETRAVESQPTAHDLGADSTFAPAVASVNALGFDLYHELKEAPGNFFFSPLSVTAALAMTSAGASGMTEHEMAEVLHMPVNREGIHRAYASAFRTLETSGRSGDYTLNVANRLWGQAGVEILKPFLDVTREQYGAEMKTMDFAKAPEQSRLSMNAWVEERTNRRIKNLLPAGSIQPVTTLVVTNVVYFLGTWASPFDTARTRTQPFHVSPAINVSVPMMHRTGKFPWAKLDGLSILEIPYKGDRLSMVILLPDSIDGLGRVEKRLSPDSLDAWIAALTKKDVVVDIPRVRMSSQFQLNAPLKHLGLSSAFDPGLADFSRITGGRDLFLSLVVHKAFVDVSERGTEAAAATGVASTWGAVMAYEPEAFRADHPYLLLIRDRVTNALLFLGRIVDPSKSGI